MFDPIAFLNRLMWQAVLAEASEQWDGDERLLLVVCGIIAVSGLGFWSQWLGTVPKLGRGRVTVVAVLLVTLGVSFGAMLAVAWFWSAREIRSGQAYTWLVMVMGGACMAVSSGMFRWCGLSVRDDACERRNPAAVAAGCGAVLGTSFIYCGAITGEGPSFWNNLFSAMLGLTAWFALWLTLGALSPVTCAVAEDRDAAAGARLGAWLLAQGLVLGRALAGDWHSAAMTSNDFLRKSWPASALLVLAVFAERTLRPTPANPSASWRTCGAPVAAVYLALATAWVVRQGWWEGAPR